MYFDGRKRKLPQTGNIMEDNKLAVEESRRVGQLESLKGQVEGEVTADIASRARHGAPGDSQRMDQVAGQLREKAFESVAETERDVTRSRGLARFSQVVDYIFCLIYALLGMRFILALMAARSSAGFVQFIVAVTNPFYAPFKGIVASPGSDEGHTLMLPIIVAILAYGLLHIAIWGLLRVLGNRRTSI
jgi:hypothetical protein